MSKKKKLEPSLTRKNNENLKFELAYKFGKNFMIFENSSIFIFFSLYINNF